MRLFSIIAAAYIATVGAYDPGNLGAAPPGVQVTSISSSGSGCPPGMVSYAFDDKKTTLTLFFSSTYYAMIGGNYPVGQNTKECLVKMNMYVPPCYSFGMKTVDYRGHYELDLNVQAFHRTAFWFKNVDNAGIATWNKTGPFYDQIGPSGVPFSAGWYSACCDGAQTLNIENSLSVYNKFNTDGAGYVSMLKDGGNKIVLHLNWALCCYVSNCPPPHPL